MYHFSSFAIGGFVPSAAIAGVLLLLGLIILPTAMALITLGGRLLPSPETALLILGETALSPLFAAWVVGETISGRAITGGCLVLAVLLVHATLGLRESPTTS